MNKDFAHSKFEELHRRAEELLKNAGPGDSAAFSDMDILSLIHELEVYQIELQIQNEELRQAHRDLEESQRAYADLYELAPVGYLTVDNHGIIEAANQAASSMLRVPKNELIGRGLSNYIHLDDHKAYFLLIRKLADGKEVECNCEIRFLRAKVVPFYARIEVGRALDGSGRLTGWRIVLSDISGLKNAEEQLKSYAEKLERSNEELLQFAFIASHDLQEPLRKVKSFGDMLRKQYAPALGEQGSEYLDRMCNGAGRLQEMISSLLEYSRVFTMGSGFVSVDLGEIVRDVVSDLEWQIERAGAEVAADWLPTVEADPAQMRRLFQNLISNSLKFCGKTRTIIRISCRPDENTTGKGQTWRIFVQDNGLGFDQSKAESIFSLFTRLHARSAYEGHGMGLAICRRIVERHGGRIEARGERGKGATFIITLPAYQQRAA